MVGGQALEKELVMGVGVKARRSLVVSRPGGRVAVLRSVAFIYGACTNQAYGLVAHLALLFHVVIGCIFPALCFRGLSLVHPTYHVPMVGQPKVGITARADGWLNQP